MSRATVGAFSVALLSCTSVIGLDGTYTTAAEALCSTYLETYCIGAHSIKTFDETSCEQATAGLTGQQLKDCVGQAQAKVAVAADNNSGCAPLLQCLVGYVGFGNFAKGTQFTGFPCLGSGNPLDPTDTGCNLTEACCVQSSPCVAAPSLALGFCQ